MCKNQPNLFSHYQDNGTERLTFFHKIWKFVTTLHPMARYRGRLRHPRHPRLNKRRESRHSIMKVLIQALILVFEMVVAMYQAPW